MWASGSGQQFEIQAGNTQLKGYLQITNPQALGQGSKSGVRASGHRRETGRERAAFQTIDLEVRKKTDARQQKVPGVEGRSKMGGHVQSASVRATLCPPLYLFFSVKDLGILQPLKPPFTPATWPKVTPEMHARTER